MFAFRTSARSIPTTRFAVKLMHRDTKLGLALAILVMGFAAALCFPRQSGEGQSDLSLQTAADLDAAIRLMSAKTYTDADRRESRPADKSAVDVAQSESEPLQEVLPLAGVPDPILVPNDPEPTPIEPSSLPPEVIAEPEQPVVHSRTYLVQNGDTLSWIAGEELGSTKRYREILDANPILGGNELALRPGMKLVIPIPSGDDLSTPPPAVQPANSAATVPRSPEDSSRIGATPRLFSPVPRVGSSKVIPSPK